MKQFLKCTILLFALSTTAALVTTSFTPAAIHRSMVSHNHHHHHHHHHHRCTTQHLSSTSIRRHTTFLHLSSPSPQDDESNTLPDTTKNYPIDAPSPILLSSSMLLAITSVGSIFELIGGSPMMGFIPSVLFALVGVPSCLFLFYAAIKKGAAETEADDAEYRKDYY